MRYNPRVDKGGQTIPATEFAALTGVSRERLRTWERRFGFPLPRRSGDGPRRYALTDAARVVAVRRAAEQGVPLARAIEASATVAGAPAVSDTTLAAVVAHAPTPTLVVAGPAPLQVLYANAPLRAFPGGDATGQLLDVLPWFAGSDLERTLRTLFSSDAPALECTHPAWNGGDDRARSLAWRLPVHEGEPPAVAVVGIDRAQDRRTRRELVETRRELRRCDGASSGRSAGWRWRQRSPSASSTRPATQCWRPPPTRSCADCRRSTAGSRSTWPASWRSAPPAAACWGPRW